MARKTKRVNIESRFDTTNNIIVDGFTVESGDIIKIKGQYGSKFIFQALVSNRETGVQWIDCIELDKGQPGPFRSFYPDSVKRIPKRRKGVRNRTDSAS